MQTIHLEKIRLEQRNVKGNFVLVANIEGFSKANLWLEKHKDKDVRAIASCGCVGYVAWSWEECAEHNRKR
jgi:hypothetical protein